MFGELVNLVKRDYDIENKIDFKYTMYSLHSDSIKLFFDVLYQLIHEYNETLSRREYSRLCNFIKFRPFPNSFNSTARYDNSLSNQETDYLVNISNYYTNLKLNVIGDYRNRTESIKIVCDLCAKLLISKASISEILEKAKRSLAPFIMHSFSTDEHDDYGVIFFHQDRLSIYIIGNWKTFHPPKDANRKILILNLDFEQFSSDLQKLTYVEKIFYTSKNGRINNFSVLDIHGTIQRLLDNISKEVSSSSTSNFDVTPVITIINSIQGELLKMQTTFNGEYRINSASFIKSLEKIKDLFKEAIVFFRRIPILKSCQPIANISLSHINNVIKISHMTSSLHAQVTYSLSEIKKNNALYIVSSGKKNEEKIYGEENLSAIIASNLRCLNLNNTLTITCEALVGNGRSDIHISKESNTIGIIESKLIRKEQDIKKEILGGIEQLFNRYSENDSMIIEEGIQLHLVIFTLDKDITVFDKKIDEAIEIYGSKFKLERDDLSKHENHITFTYERPISSSFLKLKRRTITIHICNLELDYKIRLNRAKYAK
ncbi:hypothetical protein [Pectobacterium carotovorum]|uniref:hypothetical protein n=1 Tax=Pectobacterium carotovorum TaxID=554 RepID=UPI001E2C7D90|nr:hypothetical protein [Pectobacterium carotovorum]UFT95366.1 hypothetical protein LQF52_04830 [Pectobacterium carotovorum]